MSVTRQALNVPAAAGLAAGKLLAELRELLEGLPEPHAAASRR